MERMGDEASPLTAKLNSFMPLSQAEAKCLADVQSSTFTVQQGEEFVHQGQNSPVAYIVQSGWGCSSKILADGGRQVITFPVPGDCVGLRSVLLRTADHSVTALTDVVVSKVEVPRMLEIFREFPHLGAAFLWATSRDEAMVVEHLASIGRRSAIARTAYFFLELYDRLKLVGLVPDGQFFCPLTQYELADALGLSAIHVNRVLRRLRERDLMTVKDHMVTLHNERALKALAGYENPEEGVVLLRGKK
jgi:CRP-like cAMP-binding protein